MSSFITRMRLLLELLSKMYFLLHTSAFDDAIKSKILKFLNMNTSRTERVLKVTWKTFFLVSKVLSFTLKKQNSKNMLEIAFKHTKNSILKYYWSFWSSQYQKYCLWNQLIKVVWEILVFSFHLFIFKALRES